MGWSGCALSLVYIYACARVWCMCVCMRDGVTASGWVVVTKGRFLFLRDVSRPATPLYGIYFYIGKKYSRNREWGRKCGRVDGGNGAAGSRWTEGGCRGDRGRAGGWKQRRNERKEGSGCAVFTKGHVARPPFFPSPPFNPARAIFRFFQLPGVHDFPPWIFGDFVRGRKQKGRRSVKSNSANVRRFPHRKHSGSMS